MMGRPARVMTGFLLLAVAMSGCLAGESQVFGPGFGQGTATGTNELGNSLPLAMQAAPARGEAPLQVRFNLKAPGAADDANWTLDFGDGTPVQAGQGLPVDLQHTYLKAGSIRVLFSVDDGVNGSRATLTVEVLAPRTSSTTAASTTTTTSTTTTSSPPPPPPPTTTTTTTTTTTSSTTSPTYSSTTSSTATSTTSTTSSTSNTTTESSSTSTTGTTTSDTGTTTSDTGTTTSGTSTSGTTSETTTTSGTGTTSETGTSTSATTSETTTTSDTGTTTAAA